MGNGFGIGSHKRKCHQEIGQHDHFRIEKVVFEQATGQKRDHRTETG